MSCSKSLSQSTAEPGLGLRQSGARGHNRSSGPVGRTHLHPGLPAVLAVCTGHIAANYNAQ